MNVDRSTRKLMADALAVLVGLALVAAPARGQQTEAGEPGSREHARIVRVKILGMSCPFCAYGVQQKLKRLEGVEQLEVELKSGVATLTLEKGADVPNATLKKTVEDAGFEAAAIVRSYESDHPDWNPEELPGTESSRTIRAGG